MEKKGTVMDKEFIERKALLDRYDAEHVGPPGRARELIAAAPAADVVPMLPGEPIEHMRELLQAEQDGRLVVLPCNKVLTNADRMRTSTNQQLAKQIYDNQKEFCRMLYEKLGFEDELNFSEDYSDILSWLNATPEESEKALVGDKNY